MSDVTQEDREAAQEVIFMVARHNQLRGLPVSDALLDEIAARIKAAHDDGLAAGIAQERERCAGIAETEQLFFSALAKHASSDMVPFAKAKTAGHIAAAIRSGT